MTWGKKILIIISIIAIIGIFDFWLWGPRQATSPKSANTRSSSEVKLPAKLPTAEPMANNQLPNNENLAPFKIQPKESAERELNLKQFVLLDVPFTSQAPYGLWGALYNEACEETVLIIAQAWLNDEKLAPAEVDKKILQAVAWQEKKWGGHFDLPVKEVVKMAKEYFKIEKIRFEYGIDLADIKKELSQGNLVIVPTAGRVLENPYYRQPGPYYHMLVVIGYSDKEIITNDPGTKRGKNFKYFYDNFFKAIHDWPGSLGTTQNEVNILAGRKAMIVVER